MKTHDAFVSFRSGRSRDGRHRRKHFAYGIGAIAQQFNAVRETAVARRRVGTEQSGPEVALGTHNARVKVRSQRIAEGLGNAIAVE